MYLSTKIRKDALTKGKTKEIRKCGKVESYKILKSLKKL
jgi:hypothetical protein